MYYYYVLLLLLLLLSQHKEGQKIWKQMHPLGSDLLSIEEKKKEQENEQETTLKYSL